MQNPDEAPDFMGRTPKQIAYENACHLHSGIQDMARVSTDTSLSQSDRLVIISQWLGGAGRDLNPVLDYTRPPIPPEV